MSNIGGGGGLCPPQSEYWGAQPPSSYAPAFSAHLEHLSKKKKEASSDQTDASE